MKFVLPGNVGHNYWRNAFSTKSMLFCLVEVLKNSFDWNASRMRFLTNERTDQLRCIDDGCGMDLDNRIALVSVGCTTANSPEQSGAFGSGFKYLVFSFGSYVRIVTAPDNEKERDLVYVFEFTPDQLAQMWSGGAKVTGEVYQKTPEIWPHDHDYGTDITITFANPRSSAILRGDKLRQRLSDRLDMVMAHAVTVDDIPLPDKQIVGSIYRYELPERSRPRLGRVRLEFYRPTKPNAGQKLLLTGRVFGEVTFDRFVDLLREDQFEQIPELFRRREVCGLISAAFLNEHISEDRETYNPSLADDERVMMLLDLLHQVELDVAHKLNIELRTPTEAANAGEQDIEAVLNQIGSVWGLEPTFIVEDDRDKEPPEKRPGPPRTEAKPHIHLNQSGQFAIGEEIVATLVVPEGSPEGFHFYLDQARGKLLSHNPATGEVRLKANQPGRAVIAAINTLTGQSAEVIYEVVTERFFGLSTTHLTVGVGSKTMIHTINTDKVEGEIRWELDGELGELDPTPRGRSATFKSKKVGSVRVTAYDSARPAQRRHSCEISIIPTRGGRPAIRIRDELFHRLSLESLREEHRKPVTLIRVPGERGSGQIHSLVFNPLAPGFQEAQKAGTLRTLLLQAIALEYVMAFEIVLEDEMVRPDVERIFLDLQREAFQLYAEMISVKK